MRPIYVQSDRLTPDRVTYYRYEEEAALSIGDYRLSTPSNDLTQLREADALFQRIAAAANHAHRDVRARIEFLERQAEQRAMAATGTRQRPYLIAPASGPIGTVPQADAPSPAGSAPSYFTSDNAPCSCGGDGCPRCFGVGLAVVASSEAPAEQTRDLRPVPTPAGLRDATPVSEPTPTN